MRLSVVLPTYNMEKYLARCLDSLLNQDVDPREYEIIIINDSSTDRTLEIAKQYKSEFNNIRVHSKENGGAGAARNTGLDLAKGDFIHFVDPDDYIAKNVYGTLLKCADSLKLEIAGFLFTKTTRKDWFETDSENLDSLCKKVNVVDGYTYIAENNYRNTVWWYLIKRSFLEQTGLRFIEGKWMEDSILTPQLFMAADRIGRINLDVYRYMITPNSAMTSTEPMHYHKLISDIENATFVFDDILSRIPTGEEKYVRSWNRIKTRQESFVFHLLVRLMKSRLPIKHISKMIQGFKKINAYPMNHFIGPDYNSPAYRILTWIYNRETLMYPFMRIFRLVYAPFR